MKYFPHLRKCRQGNIKLLRRTNQPPKCERQPREISDLGGESKRSRWPGLSESELGLENRQIKGLLRVEGLAYSKAGG